MVLNWAELKLVLDPGMRLVGQECGSLVTIIYAMHHPGPVCSLQSSSEYGFESILDY